MEAPPMLDEKTRGDVGMEELMAQQTDVGRDDPAALAKLEQIGGRE